MVTSKPRVSKRHDDSVGRIQDYDIWDYDEELRQRCIRAVRKLGRWLEDMQAERARHPDAGTTRKVKHDPFYWG